MEWRKTGKTDGRDKGNKIKAERGKSSEAERDGAAERRGSPQGARVPGAAAQLRRRGRQSTRCLAVPAPGAPRGSRRSIWAVAARWAERAGQVAAQAEQRCCDRARRQGWPRGPRNTRRSFRGAPSSPLSRSSAGCVQGTRSHAGQRGGSAAGDVPVPGSSWDTQAVKELGGLKAPELGGSGSARLGTGAELCWHEWVLLEMTPARLGGGREPPVSSLPRCEGTVVFGQQDTGLWTRVLPGLWPPGWPPASSASSASRATALGGAGSLPCTVGPPTGPL